MQLHNETFGLDGHRKLTAEPETGSTPTHHRTCSEREKRTETGQCYSWMYVPGERNAFLVTAAWLLTCTHIHLCCHHLTCPSNTPSSAHTSTQVTSSDELKIYKTDINSLKMKKTNQFFEEMQKSVICHIGNFPQCLLWECRPVSEGTMRKHFLNLWWQD